MSYIFMEAVKAYPTYRPRRRRGKELELNFS